MDEQPRTLDFLVIGAQKCGTTTLFEHLRHHPQLYLPPSKEAPFFNRPQLYGDGRGRLLEIYFSEAPVGTRLGKVTPDYMAEKGIAQRIKSTFPNVRLISILRDPVDRAFSEYQMAVRRLQEHREFDDAINDCLEPDVIQAARSDPTETTGYVSRGEYGRILSEFLLSFPSKQLLVIYLDDLEKSPGDTMSVIYRHIGVDDYDPPSLGERFFVGGGSQRIPGLIAKLDRPTLRRMWHTLPMRYRDLIFHRIERWNTPKATDSGTHLTIGSETRYRLRRYYDRDSDVLATITGESPPWLETR